MMSSNKAIVFGSVSSSAARKPASVRATCEAIGLARSTYYYQSHRSVAALEFEQKIVLRLHELKNGDPNAGYRAMTRQLQLEGLRVNRKRIARLMKLHGLTAKTFCADAGTRIFPHARRTVENLCDATQLAGSNRRWIADIAYVHLQSSLVYVAALIDAWSRDVVGYAASLQASGRLASIALHSAVRAQRPVPGCIHHSMCGTHYLIRGYRGLLRQYGLVPSVSDLGERSVLLPPNRMRTASSHQVVELQGFEAWGDVAGRTREFVQTLYSADRISGLLNNASPRVSQTARPLTPILGQQLQSCL